MLHDRMPVILGSPNWPAWLGEEPAHPAQLTAMLAPYSADEMTCWPVSHGSAMLRTTMRA
jgi:putative SOS response-associated peptidase YedK